MENNTDKQREKPNPDGTAASPQNRGPSPEEAPEETGARHFVHLHTHTEYSLLDGSNKIKEYVARVKELGMDSAAITDHGVMYGVIDFYRECKSAGINPVIGCEVYVAPGSKRSRERPLLSSDSAGRKQSGLSEPDENCFDWIYRGILLQTARG